VPFFNTRRFTVHRKRTRFFSSIKKFSDARWFDSSARRFLSENVASRRRRPPDAPGAKREYPSIFSLYVRHATRDTT
jgi:hypothetical protein